MTNEELKRIKQKYLVETSAKIKELQFDRFGNAYTTTKSGKKAGIYENDRCYRKPHYQLIVDGKTIFTRANIEKVLQTLEEM